MKSSNINAIKYVLNLNVLLVVHVMLTIRGLDVIKQFHYSLFFVVLHPLTTLGPTEAYAGSFFFSSDFCFISFFFHSGTGVKGNSSSPTDSAFLGTFLCGRWRWAWELLFSTRVFWWILSGWIYSMLFLVHLSTLDVSSTHVTFKDVRTNVTELHPRTEPNLVSHLT